MICDNPIHNGNISFTTMGTDEYKFCPYCGQKLS